jgi:hypothetical protein
LKVLKPELAAVLGAERFLAEIKTTANLQHPHILPLHDSGEVDGTVFYVMPYVQGESLRDRLTREKQLPIVGGGAPAAQIYAAERGRELWVEDWSNDSTWILFAESGPNANDVKAIKADGSGDSIVIAATAAEEYDPHFSPNDRWVAYQGGSDVYLVSFPDLSRRFQLGPGVDPHWSRNGQELLFWRADTLFALAVSTEGRARAAAVALFSATGFSVIVDYDVTADGQRFVIRLPNPDAYARGIDVILNRIVSSRLRQQSGGK